MLASARFSLLLSAQWRARSSSACQATLQASWLLGGASAPHSNGARSYRNGSSLKSECNPPVHGSSGSGEARLTAAAAQPGMHIFGAHYGDSQQGWLRYEREHRCSSLIYPMSDGIVCCPAWDAYSMPQAIDPLGVDMRLTESGKAAEDLQAEIESLEMSPW
jgi:hypothetical protein